MGDRGLRHLDAGAVVVPLSTRYKAVEAGETLSRTGTSILVANARFHGSDYLRMLTAEFEARPTAVR